ncbi:MAG: chorismate synthase [Erysipelothrix sp.]|nr:chorismate synthase [Erysipelothrix sp.]
MYTLGNNLTITIFGASHDAQMGVTINGLGHGLKLDLEQLDKDLLARRPKRPSETARVEADEYEIVSGYYNGYTTGTPLTFIVKNKDVNSKSYDHLRDVYRPSHADYPADVHYEGYNDPRGGGMFSGRLTVLFVIAGSLAKSLLEQCNVKIITRIKQVKDQIDSSFSNNFDEDVRRIKNRDLAVLSDDFEQFVKKEIHQVKLMNNSLGAILESKVVGVKVGLGEPYFNKLDSKLAQYIMSIGAIKGVSFGDGFDFVHHLGSQVLDEYEVVDHKIQLLANHNGGIVGGLSTGAPIIINTIVKPTPSINLDVKTVSKSKHENIIHQTKGRHDSSIFTRIPIVLDCMIALAILDLYCKDNALDALRGEK